MDLSGPDPGTSRSRATSEGIDGEVEERSADEPEVVAAGGEPERRSGRLAMWLRIVVSVALLTVLISNVPDLDGILPARDHRQTASWLAAAVVATFLGIVLSAWRWQRVLRAYDAPVGLMTLSSHYVAGQFVGNVLPSTIGGDVLRVARGSRSTGSSEVAFGSVVLERLTGFFALPFLVAMAFVMDPDLLDHERAWLALFIAGATLGALALILVAGASPRFAGRFRDHENWMRFIGAVHVGIERIREHPSHLVAILSTAVLYQVSVVISVVCIANALDLNVPVAALFMVVPVVAMVQVLPLSINGLGVREGMLVLLLVPLGVSSGQAIALGLIWYAAVLVVSMAGAPAFAVGHRHRASEQTAVRDWRSHIERLGSNRR